MSAHQEHWICWVIQDRIPDQLRMPYALWTPTVASGSLELQLGIWVPVGTVEHYLKLRGFTPQTPIKNVQARQGVQS